MHPPQAHRHGRPVAVLDAPSNLGLSRPAAGREPGCRRAPAALRAHGLLGRLGALDAGEVPAPPYSDVRDVTGTRNGLAIARYSRRLAHRTAALLEEGCWPLVLGGDCSILLGNLLALRQRSRRVGLLFLDGHLDFRHPATGAPVGAVAGEDLALATGRGHPELADLAGGGPLVADADVVALGNREWDEESLPARKTAMTILDLGSIRASSPAGAAARAVARLRERQVDEAWLHFDVDVIDSELMPAVDSPAPDGLSWEEAAELLAGLLADPIVAGMQITVFDPDRDADGRLGDRLVALLAAVVRRSAQWEEIRR
jgi:arginase